MSRPGHRHRHGKGSLCACVWECGAGVAQCNKSHSSDIFELAAIQSISREQTKRALTPSSQFQLEALKPRPLLLSRDSCCRCCCLLLFLYSRFLIDYGKRALFVANPVWVLHYNNSRQQNNCCWQAAITTALATAAILESASCRVFFRVTIDWHVINVVHMKSDCPKINAIRRNIDLNRI